MSGDAWVFAYGSNMHLADLARWCRERGHAVVRPRRVEPASLDAHRLCWNYRSAARGGGAANVEPAAGERLPGLALLVTPEDLATLDAKEGYPDVYGRSLRPLELRSPMTDAPEARVEGWVYEVNSRHREASPVLPHEGYARLLLEAARVHDLDHLPMLEELYSRVARR